MRTPRSEAREPRWPWLVPLVALAVALGVIVANPIPLRALRNATFDQFQRWSPRATQALPVCIVDIDDESLRRLGQWPWPRERVAKLVDEIGRLQPAATAMDVMFAEPDHANPAGQSSSDDELARALARGTVAIGFALSESAAPARGGRLPTKAGYLTRGGDPLPFITEFTSSVSNLPQLQEAAAGEGAMTFIPDDDGIVRKVPLLMNLDGQLVPSLVAEALRLASHAPAYVVDSAGDRGGVVDVRIGGRRIATDASGAISVHYSRPVPERYVPAWQVIARQVPANRLNGRIVLVGTSAQGLMDLRFSPRGVMIPGVEIHAQALEQVLAGQRLERPGWTPAFEWLAMLLAGALVGTIATRRGAVASTATFLVLTALLCTGAWILFVWAQVLVDPLVPTLGLVLVFLPTTLVRHLLTERQQRWIRQAFSRYVSPNLVDYLIAHPETLALGGKRQRCSFVFTDLAGFTTLMETMEPSAAVAVLNGYLDQMIAIAFEHGGTLDRIVGDAVAIVFSTPIEQPDHERRAVGCALRMHAFATRYVEDLRAQGVAFCQTRIGVHTGEVTVGNFGGGTIFDYRALGDPVNVAARLEGANKHLGTLVCISEATLAPCPDVPARPIGRLRLAGRSEPVMTYEPLAVAADDPDARTAYLRAFDLMRSHDDDAISHFHALAERRPGDPLVRLHLTRLRAGLRGDEVELAEK
jgi:adenylate cyclase